MSRFKRLCVTVVAFGIVATVAGCGGASRPGATVDPGFTGHWTSTQWGEHYILVRGDTVKIIYTHDNGRFVGRLVGSTATGWWTETPSRRPSADAGDVTFTLIDSSTTRTIDGRWRYGTAGGERENWDLTWVDATIPADIQAEFGEDAVFIAHP
jgi:hypothetical protein